MSQKNVVVYKNFNTPKEVGQHFRLMCLTGQKKGEIYYLTGNRIVLGRGDETDIQVHDMKTSREHAEIKKVGGDYFVTDLGSQNGVIVNDAKITQYKLKDNDTIVIGQTVYKYGIVNNISPDAKNVKGKLELAKNDQEKDDLAEAPDFEDKEKKAPKKKFLIFIVAGAAFMFFLDDSEPPKKVDNQKSANETKDVTDEFASIIKKKRTEEDKDLEEKLNVIFQRGLREAREGNYFRAISEFNLALILSPQNARASFYLNKTMQKLNDEVDQSFIQASRYQDALKFEASISSYCSILRLLQSYPNDERYKTALEKLKDTEKTLGMDEGEIKCL